MAADPTLIQAAFNLGKSKVPGDYSNIFNKQYEGLIASNKARYKAMGDVAKTVGDTVEVVSGKIEARQKADMKADNLLFNDAYEGIATDISNASLQKSGKKFQEGSSQNKAHVDAATAKFDNLKDQLSVLSNKSFLSKDEKKLQADLRRKAEKMKKNLVEAKGNVIANTSAYLEGHVNNSLSFKGNPEEQVLFAQVHDPDADLEALGISVYWDENEELNYSYTPNRLQKEYERNNPGSEGAAWSGEVMTISSKQLTSMMRLKGVKANNDANALITKASSAANEVIGKTKNLVHTDFNRVGASIYNDYKSLFLNQKTDIEDLTTREVLVGNTNRIYKSDIGSNGGIDEAIINQLGIGSDVFTAKELADGKIDASELAKHEDAKAEIIEKLTNPQTTSEREIAASELARYWTLHAKSEFDYIREQSKPKPSGTGKSAINPYGIPKDGLRLGDPMPNGYQIGVRQDLVTSYINDIKTGEDFKFLQNNYSFVDGNWYENHGTKPNESGGGGEVKFDNTQAMVDDVFQTGGKYFNGLETVVEIDPETGEEYSKTKEVVKGTQSSFSSSINMSFMDKDDNDIATSLQGMMPSAFSGENPNGYQFKNLKSILMDDFTAEAVGLYDDDENIVRYPEGHPKEGDKVIIYTGGNKERRITAISTLDDILNTEQFKIKGFGGNTGSTGNDEYYNLITENK